MIFVKNNIKILREKNNMMQRELAEKLGVTAQAISSWEIGRTEPSFAMIEKMALIFGCKAGDIIEAEEQINCEQNIQNKDKEPFKLNFSEMHPDTWKRIKPYMNAFYYATDKAEIEIIELWRKASFSTKMEVYKILSESSKDGN